MQAAESEFDYLELLNDAQRRAATFGSRTGDNGFRAGPLLVIAGAGSGQKRAWVERFRVELHGAKSAKPLVPGTACSCIWRPSLVGWDSTI